MNPIDDSVVDSNSGFYVIGEKYLSDNLAVFFQLGQSDEDNNQIGQYYGGGIVYLNAFKEGDAIGAAFAHAVNGDQFRDAYTGILSSETAFEISYNLPWSEIVSSQFSLYHIKHPDMDPTIDDAVAAGIRLVIGF